MGGRGREAGAGRQDGGSGSWWEIWETFGADSILRDGRTDGSSGERYNWTKIKSVRRKVLLLGIADVCRNVERGWNGKGGSRRKKKL